MATLASVILRDIAANRPAAGTAGRLFYDTTNSKMQRDNGSSWDDVAELTSGLSNPMTTTGDIIVGGASGTPARLALGAVGGAVSRVNGAVAWNSGTSNPGAAAAGDRYWRSDLGQEIYYDGTRWLTTTLYREMLGQGSTAQPAAADGNIGRLTPWSTTYDLWLDTFYSSTNVQTTNDGTKFWTITLQKAVANDTKTSIVSFTTAADTVNQWARRGTAIGALYAAATYFEMDVQATRTSTPGTLYWALALSYRLVIT